MLLALLLLVPLFGIYIISSTMVYQEDGSSAKHLTNNVKTIKTVALTTSIINLVISLIVFILFDFSTNQYQFVQEYHEI